MDRLASDLGLQKVGWIFTDLVAEDVRKGTVKHLRDINTHFLTAEECLMAGDFQNQHPSACRLSSTGKFGSKFVTVVCSGEMVTYRLHVHYIGSVKKRLTGCCASWTRYLFPLE